MADLRSKALGKGRSWEDNYSPGFQAIGDSSLPLVRVSTPETTEDYWVSPHLWGGRFHAECFKVPYIQMSYLHCKWLFYFKKWQWAEVAEKKQFVGNTDI